jgi:ComF family protein
MSTSEVQACGHCTLHPPVFTHTQAPLLYEAPFKQLISAFKFQQRLHLAAALGRLFCQQLPRTHTLPDLILPVPLHPSRLRERGFNQSLELARRVASELRLPMAHRGCRRVIATPPQRGLEQRARQKNLRRAFTADASVKGLHIALFDDVITTGATVTAASQALLHAGARQVDVWALARTPLP